MRSIRQMLSALRQNPHPTAKSDTRAPMTIGGYQLPREVETLHVLAVGTTGAGKTTLIQELLDGAMARGDRCIVCDPNASYLATFASTGDRVLNPFDARSEGWSVFNEVRADYDADRIASSIVPPGHGDSAAWHHYAQVLLAEVLRALVLSGETTTERLLYWSTSAPAAELAGLLAGTPASELFDAGADRALASTRFVLTAHLAPHRYMPQGDFSLRDWVAAGTRNIFLTWRADMQVALAPLVAAWVDIAANAVLSLPPNPSRRMWLVLDELAALGKLGSLEACLTLGRKHGLACVAGLQSTAQLDRAYGREASTVLRSCFRNLVVLALARSDPGTADEMSRALGQREVVRREFSGNYGSGGVGSSEAVRVHQERLVLPSEIAGLPNLSAFLAIAGDEPIRRVQLVPRDREQVVEPFEELAAC